VSLSRLCSTSSDKDLFLRCIIPSIAAFVKLHGAEIVPLGKTCSKKQRGIAISEFKKIEGLNTLSQLTKVLEFFNACVILSRNKRSIEQIITLYELFGILIIRNER
jgi:hypothetical protein